MIPRERLMEIINGDEPTEIEKEILVSLRNQRMKAKMKEDAETEFTKLMYENLRKELDLSKKNVNKRRNMRKKLRRQK